MSDKEIEEMRLPPAPLVPLGRHGTECNTWLRMQLHDIDSGVRKRSGSVAKITTNYILIIIFTSLLLTTGNLSVLDRSVFD